MTWISCRGDRERERERETERARERQRERERNLKGCKVCIAEHECNQRVECLVGFMGRGDLWTRSKLLHMKALSPHGVSCYGANMTNRPTGYRSGPSGEAQTMLTPH